MIDRGIDGAVTDRFRDDALGIGNGIRGVESELCCHVSKGDTGVGDADVAEPGSDDVVAESDD